MTINDNRVLLPKNQLNPLHDPARSPLQSGILEHMRSWMSFINTPEDRPLRKRLWQLSYPTMISFALQNVYDLVDLAWIGQLGSKALSGVTLFSTLFAIFGVLNEVAGASSVSMISQSYGRGDWAKTRRIAERTLGFKVLLAILSAALTALLLPALLRLYTQDPEELAAVWAYAPLRLLFLPITFSSYSVNTIYRCTQDAKTPMRILMVSALLNLVLDPFFIFDTLPVVGWPGLGLGVAGASLATVLATTVSFIYGLIFLLDRRKPVYVTWRGVVRLDREIDWKLLVIGLPSGLQSVLRNLFGSVTLRFIALYGSSAVALYGIRIKLAGFALMPIFGFQIACSALVGESLGQNQLNQAKRACRLAAQLQFLVVGSAALLLVAFAAWPLRLFGLPPALDADGILMIRFLAVELCIAAVSFALKSAFSGSGDNRPILVASLVSRWGLHLPLLYLFAVQWHWPLSQLWWSFGAAEAVEWLITYWYYRKGAWLYRRI